MNFFFNDTATTEIYTLSLHDALPISGATQAELKLYDDSINILMCHIKDGILKKIDERKIKILFEIKNELSNEHADVEHIITLYESTGIPKHDKIARELKKLFREEIQEKILKLGDAFKPKLFSAFIDMHEIDELGEELVGILTLNYEDILEKAMQMVKGGVNYSIKIKDKHSVIRFNNSFYPILKLHGSFNWKNDIPVILLDEKKIKKEEDVLWIPPGVEKRRERYPFSILWDRAREILDCDILRVVGCSLSRNDWHLVSLLYTTQKLNSSNKPYIIELINSVESGEETERNYPYLSFRNISDIKEIREYMKNTYFPKHKEEDAVSKLIRQHLSQDNKSLNVFDVWLKAKGESLRNQSIDIKTASGLFEGFMNEV